MPEHAPRRWPYDAGVSDERTADQVPESAPAEADAVAAAFERAMAGGVSHRQPGDRVGPYRLERPLGRGGFGDVWCALQESLGRRVALKLLRPDRIGTRSMRRFEAERESLRLLAHPNVAKIYDAGTTDEGEPFIAMEYIEGISIVQYCDRLRLTIDERMRLWASVCEAMHYVHLQGIIHRDLSPDNILVSLSGPEEGQPKIIDFGIARPAERGLRLSEETIGEGFGQVVGKLMYMSPEQAEAGPGGVDVRTDIYALGVILYELIAGVLPVDGESLRTRPLTEAVRLLVDFDRPLPAKRVAALPSADRRRLAEARRESSEESLLRRLESRIRSVPMTAMQIDRTRRFSSAAAMAEDLRRALDGRDFGEASDDGWWDRLGRRIRRHRLLSAAILLVALSLTGGVVGIVLGLQQARQSAAIAEDRLALSESVIAYLTDDLLGADEQSVAPADTTVEDLLASAPERIDRRFADRPEVRARLLGAIGAWALQTGQRERADALLTVAREAAEQAGADPLQLGRIDLLRSEALWRGGQAEEARAVAEEAVARFAAELGPGDPLTLAARNQMAGALKHAGRPAEAESIYREVLAERLRVLSATHIDTLITEHNLALAIFMQAKAEPDPERKRVQVEAALAIELPAWERTKRAHGADHEQALAAGSEVAAMLLTVGKLEDAERVYAEILPLMRARLGEGHWRVRTTLANYGRLLLRLDRLDRAIPELDAALAGYKSRVGVLSPDTATIASWLAEAHERRGDRARAEATLVELYERIVASPPGGERQARAKSQAARIADFLERNGQPDAARSWRERAGN
jgi:eukaryotic-like serine/threonine-protein kinase